MSAIKLTVTIDEAQIEGIVAAVAERVVAALQRLPSPTSALSSAVADLGARRDVQRPGDSSRRMQREAAITPRQFEILNGWRNRRALEDALQAVVGDAAIELAGLSKAEASSVLDALTPPEARRQPTAARR